LGSKAKKRSPGSRGLVARRFQRRTSSARGWWISVRQVLKWIGKHDERVLCEAKERLACIGDTEPSYCFGVFEGSNLEGAMGPVQLQRLARGYLKDRRFMEALVVAKKGAKLFPSFLIDFQMLLAEVYLGRGDRKEARALLEQILTAHPQDQRVQQALAQVPD
jgi:tetratricopeptide (TPR) repeat protein